MSPRTKLYVPAGSDAGRNWDAQWVALGESPVYSFDPLSIAWHAAYWAEDPNWTDPGDGNAVSQWDDASGNGRHATQGTASRQPLYRSSVAALNNKPAVEGDGSDDMLDVTFATNVPETGTIVAVGFTSALNVGADQSFVHSPSTGERWSLSIDTSATDEWTLYQGNQGITGGTGDTQAHLFIATYGPTDTLEVDGMQVISGNAGSEDCGGIRLFNNLGDNTPLNGDLAFVGLYEGTLTSQEKDDLLVWSQDHYGTP